MIAGVWSPTSLNDRLTAMRRCQRMPSWARLNGAADPAHWCSCPKAPRERLANAPYFSRVKHESLDGADLVSVRLNQLRFDRCALAGADLRQATLDNCWFRFCDLRSARLRGASLRFARFAGCDLRGADLRDCDLTGAHFGFVQTGAENGRTDLTGATTEGAILDGAVFEQVTGWPSP